MKKCKIIALILSVCMILSACSVHNSDSTNATLLRIHIRANSNDECDQAVKLKVRDEINEYLSNKLDGVKDFEKAYSIVKESLGEIENQAREKLEAEGFLYGARARLINEYFPTRAYQSVVVDSGYYDALIVELGDGKGDNWWCVIYPPLCFVEAEKSDGFSYRSKIKELWDRYLKKK